jgi:hypothetical protein
MRSDKMICMADQGNYDGDSLEIPCFFGDNCGTTPLEYAQFFARVDAVLPSTVWEIIEDWKSGLIDANQALGKLEAQEMLDPDALMLGWVAFQTAMEQRRSHTPSDMPPAAPSVALEPPAHDDWSYADIELLSTLSKVRVA